MTSRYELLINSIHDTNTFILQMFLYALFVVLAYHSLGWVPVFFRRPLQGAYLTLALLGFIFVTVYSAAS